MATETETETEDFKITKEEAVRLREAMKNDEFRKLLAEYAAEISDPENKQRYEEDIRKLENERGMDVQFVDIKPGFVLKTVSLPNKNKVFINIGECALVDKATAITEISSKGKKGSRWSIPYTITKPRDDMDNGKKCVIVDVGYHPETMKQVDKDHRFVDLLIETAMEGIGKEHGLSLDRKHVKRQKCNYKGTPQPAIIRKKKAGCDTVNDSNSGPFKIPYPPLDKKGKEKRQKTRTNTEPQYSVVHRGEFDMQDYTGNKISNSVRRPKELIVTIHLPKLDSTKTVELDIFEKRLVLVNERPNYNLELHLSYPVNDQLTNATFDKSTHNLIIALPVIPPTTPLPPHPFITTAQITEEESLEIESESTPEIELKEETNIEQPHPLNASMKSDWSVNETWKCPPFSYRQNEDCISFVLHITVVREQTMMSHFGENSFHVTFKGSEKDTTIFTSYSLYVEFDGCGPVIKTDNCSINIGAVNTVIMITTLRNDIQKLRVGSSPSNLTDKLLIGNSISDVVHQLTDPWDSTGTNTSCDHNAKIVHCNDTDSVVTVKSSNTTDDNEKRTTTTTSGHGENIVTMVTTDDVESTNRMTPLAVAKDTIFNDTDSTKKLVNKPIINGCGHDNKTVQFSNDLLYDLD